MATMSPFFFSASQDLMTKESNNLISAQEGVLHALEEVIQSVDANSDLPLNPKTLNVRCNADLMKISFRLPKDFPISHPNFIRDDSEKITKLGVWYTSEEIKLSLMNYSTALAEWEAAWRGHLVNLNEALKREMSCLMTATHASIILSALTDHVVVAQQQDWTLPNIVDVTAREQHRLRIDAFWPYWMKKDEAVCNSIDLDRMAILTGPNMAGKSTILRSIAAVCCLGISGFFIPAMSASLPFIDCINLKTLITDSPLEHQSAFAVEMREMKHVLHDATDRTLVLIDELGKGTEVIGGTALSASIFKDLYDRHTIGILATHLHRIKDFLHDFPDAVLYKMEIQEDDGRRCSSWKLCRGFSEESLGLDVALQQGMDTSIVDRAAELVTSLENIT